MNLPTSKDKKPKKYTIGHDSLTTKDDDYVVNENENENENENSDADIIVFVEKNTNSGDEAAEHTSKTWRKMYSKFSIEKQKTYSEEYLSIWYLLNFSPIKVYTAENPIKNDILDRTLRFLFNARYEQAKQFTQVNPHVIYAASMSRK